jgi:hypothetical protein
MFWLRDVEPGSVEEPIVKTMRKLRKRDQATTRELRKSFTTAELVFLLGL